MDTAKPPSSQWTARLTAGTWQFMRQRRLTWGLLLVLAGVLLLGSVLPQQPRSVDGWLTALPRPLAEGLFFLGFAHLFRTVWVWLPVAGLLLHSLIMLAEITPGAWTRVKQPVPPINWQHPLARRAEHVARLSETTDASLASHGFQIDPDEANYTLSASRYRWNWLAPTAFYGGLVLLVLALFISRYALQLEHLTLTPNAPEASTVLDEPLTLTDDNAVQIGDTPLGWTMYLPTVRRGAILWPWRQNPVLAVEVRDAAGERLRLLPRQTDLVPAEQLYLPLDASNTRHYFSMRSGQFAVEIARLDDSYQVQVARDVNDILSRTVAPGQRMQIEDMSLAVTEAHSLTWFIYRDWAVPFYLAAVMLAVGSGLVLHIRPPTQIWLISEVKGRGGQLYAVVETTGPLQTTLDFVKQQLANAGEETGEN